MHSWELEGAFVALVFSDRGASGGPYGAIGKLVKRRGRGSGPAMSVTNSH